MDSVPSGPASGAGDIRAGGISSSTGPSPTGTDRQTVEALDGAKAYLSKYKITRGVEMRPSRLALSAVYEVACDAGDHFADVGGTSLPEDIRVVTVFNSDHSKTAKSYLKARKEADVLSSVPGHRSIVRFFFECEDEPPAWMLETLPDPSYVCETASDGGAGRSKPSAGPAPLQPRKALMVGTELLKTRLRTRFGLANESASGKHDSDDEFDSMPDDLLVMLSMDIAEGVHHLLQHGVVHRDLKLDNVMWDSKGGLAGVGRAVLTNLESALRVEAHVLEGSTDPEAAKPSTGSKESAAAAPADKSSSAGDGDPAASDVEKALDAFTYRGLKESGDMLGGSWTHLAPEVLDGWNKGVAGDLDSRVPFGKQASWELGVLLHQMATGGGCPFGSLYPNKLHDESKPEPGALAAALRACDTPMLKHDVLSLRPPWYADMVRGLLRIDPEDRMGVKDAVDILRSARLAEVADYLPVLAVDGPDCEPAVAKVKEIADRLIARGNWTGVYRLMWQLRDISDVRVCSDLPAPTAKLLGDISSAVADHVVRDPAAYEAIRIVKSLSSAESISAELGAFMIAQLCASGDRAQSLFVRLRALPGLVKLLGSDNRREAKWATSALLNIIAGSAVRTRAVVEAGALPGLAALVGPSSGTEAEVAIETLYYVAFETNLPGQVAIIAGVVPELVRRLQSSSKKLASQATKVLLGLTRWSETGGAQAVVDSGTLPIVIHLLESGANHQAEVAAMLLANVAAGANSLKRAAVDGGALPRLAVLLGSDTGKEAENAAMALCNIARGSGELKKAVVDAGVLPGLIGLLSSHKGEEALQAAEALAEIADGPVELKQALVDAGALKELVAELVAPEYRDEVIAQACNALKAIA